MALTLRNLWSPDASDNYALTTDMAAGADSVETALQQAANYGIGTTAQRTAALSLFPDGAMWYDVTLSAEYRRVAGAWVVISDNPYCSLRKSVDYTLTTSPAALPWEVDISDPSGMHDTATNTSRIYAIDAGLYSFAYTVYNNNASGTGYIEARLNGTTPVGGSQTRALGTTGVGCPLSSAFSLTMTAGDYVEMMVYHSAASGIVVGGTSVGSALLTVKRLGPA